MNQNYPIKPQHWQLLHDLDALEGDASQVMRQLLVARSDRLYVECQHIGFPDLPLFSDTLPRDYLLMKVSNFYFGQMKGS